MTTPAITPQGWAPADESDLLQHVATPQGWTPVEEAPKGPNLSGEDYANAVIAARQARKSVIGYFQPMTDAEVKAQLPADKQQYFEEGKKNFADYLQQQVKQEHQEDYQNTLGVIKAAPFLALPELGAAADAYLGGGAAGAAANVGLQGGGAAAITGLEGGNKQQVADAALIGAMGPVGNKVATAVAPRVGAAMEDVAGRVYQSALKPPPGSYTTPEVQSMVKTGLQEGIPVSQKGGDKLAGLVSDLNDKIKNQIIASNPNAPINPNAVASRTAAVRPPFDTVNPEQAQADISSATQEYLNKHSVQAPFTNIRQSDETGGFVPAGKGTAQYSQDYSAVAAQEEKQKTYAQLSKSYGELSSATQETQKALARGIKEELETYFPEIKGTNAQLGKLYGLDDALQRAVRRIDNHEIFGLGTRIAAITGAAAGAAAFGGEGAVTGAVAASILQKAVSDPMVKSKLAIILSRSSGLPVSAANAKVASYIAQLANAANQPMSPKEVLGLGAGPVALPAQSQPNP